MDYLEDLGLLALGSRMKRLSDRLVQEVAAIYEEMEIDFQPRWFPVFRYIAASQRSSITEIAAAVGITHPAVNQIEQELSVAGLVTNASDAKDKRRRLLSLSPKGKRLYEKLRVIWSSTHAAISDAVEESNTNLLSSILAFERALDRESLLARAQRQRESESRIKPEVVHYRPEHARHFVRLNKDWIERFFTLEQADIDLFADPEQIVRDGGEILFIRLGEKIIATCALIKEDDNTFQLAKMAVNEAYRDRGVGTSLLRTVIELAREADAEAITLETNTKLSAAINLYRKFGFVPIDNKPDSTYSRVNLVMRLELTRHD